MRRPEFYLGRDVREPPSLEAHARVPAALLGAEQQEHKVVDGRRTLDGKRPESEQRGRGRLVHSHEAQKKAAQGERLKVGPEVGTSEPKVLPGAGETSTLGDAASASSRASEMPSKGSSRWGM